MDEAKGEDEAWEEPLETHRPAIGAPGPQRHLERRHDEARRDEGLDDGSIELNSAECAGG